MCVFVSHANVELVCFYKGVDGDDVNARCVYVLGRNSLSNKSAHYSGEWFGWCEATKTRVSESGIRESSALSRMLWSTYVVAVGGVGQACGQGMVVGLFVYVLWPLWMLLLLLVVVVVGCWYIM